MRNRRERRAEDRVFLPANERFKRSFYSWVAVGVVVSAGAHAALFELAPAFRAADLASDAGSIEAIDLPPEVRIPPPPEAIQRPATPRVSAAADIREDVTIAPTTFESNPVEDLPPPPAGVVADVRERPVFIARDVEPRLKNREEMATLLRRLYPPMLKEAGVGGRVVLWVFVETDGTAGVCQIHQSSGYPALDAAAEQIAEQMRFEPALSRDKPVGVWISQPIDFQVSMGGSE